MADDDQNFEEALEAEEELLKSLPSPKRKRKMRGMCPCKGGAPAGWQRSLTWRHC